MRSLGQSQILLFFLQKEQKAQKAQRRDQAKAQNAQRCNQAKAQTANKKISNFFFA